MVFSYFNTLPFFLPRPPCLPPFLTNKVDYNALVYPQTTYPPSYIPVVAGILWKSAVISLEHCSCCSEETFLPGCDWQQQGLGSN